MRKVLLVLTIVASMLGAGGAIRHADAFECEFCELVGQIEGSGIIVPDPNSAGDLLQWEGRFTGVQHLMVAGGQPVVGTFSAEGAIGYDSGPVSQLKGWIDFTFTQTPLMPGFPADQEWTTEFFVRSFDEGASWVLSATDTTDSAIGTFATLDRNATTHSVGALRPYRGVFVGTHAPSVV